MKTAKDMIDQVVEGKDPSALVEVKTKEGNFPKNDPKFKKAMQLIKKADYDVNTAATLLGQLYDEYPNSNAIVLSGMSNEINDKLGQLVKELK